MPSWSSATPGKAAAAQKRAAQEKPAAENPNAAAAAEKKKAPNEKATPAATASGEPGTQQTISGSKASSPGRSAKTEGVNETAKAAATEPATAKAEEEVYEKAEPPVEPPPPPPYLSFAEILIQKALSAAEAAGHPEQQRRKMSEHIVHPEKQKLMAANHTVAQTCAYSCKNAASPFPKPNHNATIYADGCGDPGLKVNIDFPFESCCHKHDVCYSSCNKHKNQCDFDFIQCMNTTCSIVAPNEECRQTAVTLYDDTYTQGAACDSYLAAQEKACDCTPNQISRAQVEL